MSGTSPSTQRRSTVSVLFDMRTIIGFLFGLYGIVCLIWGLVSYTAADAKKSGGININLWSGIGMIIVSAIFIIWSLSRPLDLGESDTDQETEHTPS